MPLIISEVTSEADFEKIAAMDHEGWKVPYNPQLKHFRPYSASRDDAIAYVRERSVRAWRQHDPNTFFVKAVDTESPEQEIVGSAVWAINEMKEPGKAEKRVAHWHPDGSEERDFAEKFINGLWEFIAARVTRPHMAHEAAADLHSIVVAQSHRHRGIGRMLVRYGTTKADELGVETAVSSLLSARGMYERCGLGAIEVIPPSEHLTVLNPSKRWEELQQDDLSGWLMWRPIGHDYVAGVDQAPWLQ